MTPFALAFLILLLLKSLTEIVLEVLNLRASQAAAGKLPAFAAGVMDEATYAKSNAYTQDKARFALVNHVWDALFLGALLPTGGLAKVWGLWAGLGTWTQGTFGQALVFFLTFWTLGLPGLIPRAPVEERHTVGIAPFGYEPREVGARADPALGELGFDG